jgi:putative thioredoxin
MDITSANFEAEVIEASMSTPVLVDFWAPWCGPCKSLSPILEKLEADYAGAFRLAKINSDDEQPLAEAFGVRSIPTCVLMVGGKPVDGFMGALPESKLREFLGKHVAAPDVTTADTAANDPVAEVESLLATGQADTALAHMQAALQATPADDDLRFEAIKLMLQLGELDLATAALPPVLPGIAQGLRFAALSQWLAAMRWAQTTAPFDRAALDAALAVNKRDFDARFAYVRTQWLHGEVELALDELLEMLMRDKQWNDGAARKTYVAILELLMPQKNKASAELGEPTAAGIALSTLSSASVDPQVAWISRYRRKLSMALN